MAARIRKSTTCDSFSPMRLTTRSSRTRSSLTWNGSGVSSTSSRNTVPPSAAVELALVGAHRAGERPLGVAEQLGLDELVRDRGAVDRDEAARAARRPFVQQARRDLLAGAGLAGQQHRHRRARRLRDLAQHRARGVARGDEAARSREPAARPTRARAIRCASSAAAPGAARVDDVVGAARDRGAASPGDTAPAANQIHGSAVAAAVRGDGARPRPSLSATTELPGHRPPGRHSRAAARPASRPVAARTTAPPTSRPDSNSAPSAGAPCNA